MTDRDRAIAALEKADYHRVNKSLPPYDNETWDRYGSGGNDRVFLNHDTGRARVELAVPIADIPALLSPLTAEKVEAAVVQVREMLNDQNNDWTPKQREAGHAALDLFRLCLRQQMGGGQE